MVISTRLHPNSKYRQCCCHIETAALIIGILQLMYITMVYPQLRPFKNKTDDSESHLEFPGGGQRSNSGLGVTWKSTDDNPHSGSFYAESWPTIRTNRPWTQAADIAWDGMTAVAIVLLFYAAKWNLPYWVTPKLVFDAMTAGIAVVEAVTLATSGFQSDLLQSSLSIPAAYAILAAAVDCCIFFVTLKYFKYLHEKRALLDGLSNGIFVLPFTTQCRTETSNNLEVSNRDCSYNDMPPAYPELVSSSTGQTIEGNDERGNCAQNSNANVDVDVANCLPTYDEAQKLRENKNIS